MTRAAPTSADGTAGPAHLLGYRGRSYCLYCYAPMGVVEGASAVCPACGRGDVRADQLRYWTREPWLVRLALALKVGIALLTGASVAVLLPVLRMPHSGWLAALPIAAGTALWWSASALTRKPSGFRPAFVWVNALVIVAPVLLAKGWLDGEPRYALAAALCLLLVPCVLLLSVRFERWREHRVLGRYRQHLVEGLGQQPAPGAATLPHT